MASYNTIPTVSEDALISEPKAAPNRKVIAIVAAVCFASACAGTVAPSAVRGISNLAAKTTASHGLTQIKLKGTDKCMSVAGRKDGKWGDKIVLKDCNPKWDEKDVGQAFKVTVNGDKSRGKITYRAADGDEYCIEPEPGLNSVGWALLNTWLCDDKELDENFVWDSQTSTISMPDNTVDDDYVFNKDFTKHAVDEKYRGNRVCMTVGTDEKHPNAAGKGDITKKNPITLWPCYYDKKGRANQEWELTSTNNKDKTVDDAYKEFEEHKGPWDEKLS